MTVMRETGLIVVSRQDGILYKLSLQERHLNGEIQPPCEHLVWLLCVQVAGCEYLALSCYLCENIKLMDLTKQRNSSESQLMQYEMIRAFSGKWVRHMCQGEENRIFVQSYGNVLELDTSTTTFTEVRTIDTSRLGIYNYLCYVPHPHRLLVAYDDEGGVHAVSCDDNKEAWRVKRDDLLVGKLAYRPTDESIIVADRSSKKVVILRPSNGSWLQSILLPINVCEIRGLCVNSHQLIVCSEGRISYFSLK